MEKYDYFKAVRYAILDHLTKNDIWPSNYTKEEFSELLDIKEDEIINASKATTEEEANGNLFNNWDLIREAYQDDNICEDCWYSVLNIENPLQTIDERLRHFCFVPSSERIVRTYEAQFKGADIQHFNEEQKQAIHDYIKADNNK